MNTILTILLLVALSINIVCDIVRLFTFCRTVEQSKDNVKKTICKAVYLAYKDWDTSWDESNPEFDNTEFVDYFHDNFEKYL